MRRKLNLSGVDHDDDFQLQHDGGAQEDGGAFTLPRKIMLASSMVFLAGVWYTDGDPCELERIRASYFDEEDDEIGFISDDLSRTMVTPRPDMDAKLENYDFFYQDTPALEWSTCQYDTYWSEEAKVDMSAKAEKELMEVTFEMHNMALEAVDTIVKDDNLLELFYVNRDLWPAIRESWDKGKVDFQGRFDFAWDGKNPPKLLEYNADTPSLQLESGVLSDEWFKDKYVKANGTELHQANYLDKAIDESLTQIMYKHCNQKQKTVDMDKYGPMPLEDMAVLTQPNDEENFAVMKYFYDKILKLSDNVDMVDIQELSMQYGTDGDVARNFWFNKNGADKAPYQCLFNSYPKEWMITELDEYPMKKYDFKDLNSFEPFWKILLGNKALLPLLWSMYPNHPNLIPAYYDDPRIELGEKEFEKLNETKWVSKPIYGREGFGVIFSSDYTEEYGFKAGFDQFVNTTENHFGSQNGQKLGKSIYQAEVEFPITGERIIQTSSWIVGGMPAGIIFRDGIEGEHFEDSNPFLLHTVRGKTAEPFNFKLSKTQKKLRDKIYMERSMTTSLYQKYGGKVSFSDFAKPRDRVDGTWKQWVSYQATAEQAMKKSTYEPECDAGCQANMRARSMDLDGIALNEQASTFSAFYGFNNAQYTQGVTRFGRISKADLGDMEVWFSVDSFGRVRTHRKSDWIAAGG